MSTLHRLEQPIYDNTGSPVNLEDDFYEKSEVQALDEWELVDGTLRPKEGVAPSGMRIGSAATTLTATGDDATGDFENAGANISYVTDHWENDDVAGPNALYGLIATEVLGTMTPLANLTDDDDGTRVNNLTGATNYTLRYDLGSAVAIDTFYITGQFGYSDITVKATNSSDYSGLSTIATWDAPNDLGEFTTTITFTEQSVRYIQMEIYTGTNNRSIASLSLYKVGAATANNTVDAVIPVIGTMSLAPATTVIEDENGAEILGTGKVNLAYNLNSGGWTSLIDLQTFKALATSIFAATTSLKIRVQAVDEQQFSDTVITSVNTEVLVTPGGEVVVKVNGVETDVLTDKADSSHTHTHEDTLNAVFSTQGVGAGTYYTGGGFYKWSDTDANLTQASASVTYGEANHPYGAHAAIVAGGAGTVDTGVVGLQVTGTTITDAGVRTTSVTYVLSADITTLSANDYAEAPNFIGTVTFALYVVSGSPTAYSLDFNYGFAAYEDKQNTDFTISGFKVTGFTGATDTAFEMELLHHKSAGWTYAATGFVPGASALATCTTDNGTESDLSAGEDIKWKRTNVAQAVVGSGSEGYLYRVTVGSSNAIRYMNVQTHVAS